MGERIRISEAQRFLVRHTNIVFFSSTQEQHTSASTIHLSRKMKPPAKLCSLVRLMNEVKPQSLSFALNTCCVSVIYKGTRF